MGISARQFEELQQRLRSRPGPDNPSSKGAAKPLPGHDVPAARTLLGIDPSLRGTGWGVLHLEGGKPRGIAHGTIRCPASWEHSRCLLQIHQTLWDVLTTHPAEVCAVEGLFHARNLRTALVMGEARGAAIAAVARHGLPVFELAPRKVKLAVAGHGGAGKGSVARMVQRLLNLDSLPEPDAADALAIALAYSQEAGRLSLNPPRRV